MALYLKTLGTLSLAKGAADGQSFRAFDYIDNCTGEKCEIADKCDFLNSARRTRKSFQENPEEHQCLFHRQWLFASAGPYWEFIEKNPDPFFIQVIGQHIMPLYRHLFKMLKFELSLRSIEGLDPKGQVRIHPVYREIREIQRAIVEQFKSSGIHEAAKQAGFFKPPGLLNAGSGEADKKYGDRGYADQLAGKK